MEPNTILNRLQYLNMKTKVNNASSKVVTADSFITLISK